METKVIISHDDSDDDKLKGVTFVYLSSQKHFMLEKVNYCGLFDLLACSKVMNF